MCVIFYANICGDIILAKNRDKVYNPYVEIIHEIKNNIEIAYIKDNRGWIEGINEYGIGVVNSTLVKGADDEQLPKKNYIYESLLHKTQKDVFKKFKYIEGHSIVAIDNKVFHIENNKTKMYLNKLKTDAVFSNHSIHFDYKKIKLPKGVKFRNTIRSSPFKMVSSFLRKKTVETELDKIKKNSNNPTSEFCKEDDLYDNISNVLNKNYINLDPRFHSYRDKKMTLKKLKKNHKYKNMPKINVNNIVKTTAQIILNITKKELIFYKDTNNKKNVKYINKLPKDYIPKLHIIIKNAQKNTEPTQILSKKYLKKTYKKFKYDEHADHKNNKQKHNSTKKNLKV